MLNLAKSGIITSTLQMQNQTQEGCDLSENSKLLTDGVKT